MQILYSSLHNLDMAQDRPVRKTIPADFNSYMDAYIKFATTENDSSREYNPIDSNRTVLRCVSTIFTDVLHQGDVVTQTSHLVRPSKNVENTPKIELSTMSFSAS